MTDDGRHEPEASPAMPAGPREGEAAPQAAAAESATPTGAAETPGGEREPEPAPPASSPDADAAPAPQVAETPHVAGAPQPPPARPGFIAERAEVPVELPSARLAAQSRRDFLLFAAGVAAAGTGAWVLLPERARSRLLPSPWHDRLDTLAARAGLTPARRERALDRALTFDDDVAEALYSRDRRVRTYSPSQAQRLRNNYHGATPDPGILAGWALELRGLAAGGAVRLTLAELLRRFALRGQVTRLVCVEGWSAIAWWGGVRFADLLAAYPPAPGARWAAMRSEVGLDGAGRPDPYYVSIDLGTARHPQTILATHHGGRPLTMAHGAPLRLVAPVKLGLKNIKAITHIEYVAAEPPDYWNERGYSKYDGL